MAEEVVIPGSPYPAKIRSPWAVALLPFVTLGIYTLVWYYKINKEMAELGRARGRRDLGDSPGMSLLAVTLGALVIVPPIVSLINTFKRIQATQRLLREGEVINGWLGLVLYLVLSPAMFAYMQSGLNEAWQAIRWGSGYPPTGHPGVGHQGAGYQGAGYQDAGYQGAGHPGAGGNPAAGYPPPPGYPPAPVYPTSPGYPTSSGYPSAAGYPPAPGYPAPGYPPASGYPPAPGYPPYAPPPNQTGSE